MIDIHSHILPLISGDDGPDNYLDAVEILETASEKGLKKIVATPHILSQISPDFIAEVDSAIEQLNAILQNRKIDVKIFPGAELYLSESTFELIDRRDITLNRTGKYVLIEFPMSYKPAFAEELLEGFLKEDVIPIIAHPERYSFMLRDPNYLFELVNMGMLAQCNAESLKGVHGARIKRLVTKFIKSDLIHFIGSDVHHPTMRPWFMDAAFEEVVEILGEEDAADLVGGNAEKVIMGQELATYEPRPVEFSAIDLIKDYVVDIYQGFMGK